MRNTKKDIKQKNDIYTEYVKQEKYNINVQCNVFKDLVMTTLRNTSTIKCFVEVDFQEYE